MTPALEDCYLTRSEGWGEIVHRSQGSAGMQSLWLSWLIAHYVASCVPASRQTDRWNKVESTECTGKLDRPLGLALKISGKKDGPANQQEWDNWLSVKCKNRYLPSSLNTKINLRINIQNLKWNFKTLRKTREISYEFGKRKNISYKIQKPKL